MTDNQISDADEVKLGDWVKRITDGCYGGENGIILQKFPGWPWTSIEVLSTDGVTFTDGLFKFKKLTESEIEDVKQNMKKRTERDGILIAKTINIGDEVQDRYRELQGRIVSIEKTEIGVRLHNGIYAKAKIHPWERIYDFVKAEENKTKGKIEKAEIADADFCIDKFYSKGLTAINPIFFDMGGEARVAKLVAPVLKNMIGFNKEKVTPDSPETRGYPITIYPEEGNLAFRDYWDDVCQKISDVNPHTWISYSTMNIGREKWFYIQVRLRKIFRNF
jgi:hypothetical protein